MHDEIVPDVGPPLVSPSDERWRPRRRRDHGEDLHLGVDEAHLDADETAAVGRLATMQASAAAIERSDVAPSPPPPSLVMVALVLADALVERFGGDAIADLERAVAASTEAVGLACLDDSSILRYGERPLHQPVAEVTSPDGTCNASSTT